MTMTLCKGSCRFTLSNQSRAFTYLCNTWIVFAKLISQKSYSDVLKKRTIKNIIFVERIKRQRGEREVQKLSAVIYFTMTEKIFFYSVFFILFFLLLSPGRSVFILLISKLRDGEERLEISSCYCSRKLHKIKRNFYIFYVMQNKQKKNEWFEKVGEVNHPASIEFTVMRIFQDSEEETENFIVKILSLFLLPSKGPASLRRCILMHKVHIPTMSSTASFPLRSSIEL